MSEITRGIMSMPYEMAMRDGLSRRQFYARAREVYAECERMRERLELAERRYQQPNEIFAIVRDRHYEGEGLSLAFWNGDNYSLSDGDCFERDGDTLDGWTAEWLTGHQLEKRLEQAEKDVARLAFVESVDLHLECSASRPSAERWWVLRPVPGASGEWKILGWAASARGAIDAAMRGESK